MTEKSLRLKGTGRSDVKSGRPSSPFELIAPFITPAVVARVADLLDLRDEETVALILARMIAPDRIIGQTQEAKLRGVRHETLKKYKDEKLLPAFVNGK